MEFKNLRILRILTILIALILAVVSFSGAFLRSTYERDSLSMAAQGTGQDIVDLFLVMPLLLVSFYLLTKNNRVGILIYGGTLFYILYSFIIYCFGVNFNQLFLLYCATLGMSVYAFILYMMDIQRMNVSQWFDNPPIKLVSIYIIFVAVVFYALWLKAIVPALIKNSIPAEVSDYELPVNPVHVIDLAFALPGFIVGSLLLWKKNNLGFIISSLGLIFMIILTIALAGMVIVLVNRQVNEDFSVAAVFGVLTLSSLCVAILFFRKIRSVPSLKDHF